MTAATDRQIEVTSFAEIVLALRSRRQRASGLLEDVRRDRDLPQAQRDLRATRRKRAPDEPDIARGAFRHRSRRACGETSRPKPTGAPSSAAAAPIADRGGVRPRRQARRP